MLEADSQFLKDLLCSAIDSATIAAGDSFDGAEPEEGALPSRVNTLGFDAIRPGGRDCYPGIWIQDFAMAYSTGLVAEEIGYQTFKLFASRQQGAAERVFADSGAIAPPYSIADHILLDGSPVFYPGSYSGGEDQGGEPWGVLPPANNHYDFVWLGYQLWKQRGAALLHEQIEGLSFFERMERAFEAPNYDAATGLVTTDWKRRFVGFIFTDSVAMTGHLLVASLERYRTALQLAEIHDALGNGEKAATLRETAKTIKAAIPGTFASERGWLRASTEVSAQEDAWGSALAVSMGIVEDELQRQIQQNIIRSAQDGDLLEYEGAFRHVPRDGDFSLETMYENTITDLDTYQNGAYWHTPLGWFVKAVRDVEPELAQSWVDRFVAYLQQTDFRKGPDHHGPWETIGAAPKAFRNPVFVPSIALPIAELGLI